MAVMRKKTPRGARHHAGRSIGTKSASAAPKVAEALPEPRSSRSKFPVVGIGASAGGLEALREFFGKVPTDCEIAFVVVTHLHPGHVSLLPELLGKATKMPVVEARDGLKVKPGRVYVGMPGGILSIVGGTLYRSEIAGSHSPELPIDYFFRSLATDQREHAICIVLSGTGTDGTLGLRAIKAEAGMAMVQDLPSAKYAGMPASASATGLADYVLPPEKMPDQLVAYVKGPYLTERLPRVEGPPFPSEPLQRILILLRTRTGHDFTCYKTSTVRRRIERRMNVHLIKRPTEYVRYLQENPHELDVLFRELLISVTSFFRDRRAFDLLEKSVPEIIDTHPAGQPLRAWVPGCATGEEAFSVAILLHEGMETSGKALDVQVFGTDLDPRAIEVARAGAYGAGIAADISPKRLERYFVKKESVYHVRKDIREMLVFAPHNVVRDPPFTRLDLLVCRNLLIYLEPEMQHRLFPIFHYALRPGGFLFLGPSETIGGFKDSFETVDSKWKLFRRKESAAAVPPPVAMYTDEKGERALAARPAPDAPDPRQPHTVAQIVRVLLARFAPASVVVNRDGSIVYIHGRTGAYLEPNPGQPRSNVLEMAREELGPVLSGAMRAAAAEKREVVRENARVRTNGGWSAVNVSVAPIQEPETLRDLLLITFRPSATPQTRAGRKKEKEGKHESGRVKELERALRDTRESLQTTIEEMEVSSEEIKSTNEELQSTNEELQSTNEELETSKEEMQSLNEELTTLNTELQSKVDELARAGDDMQNLLNSTQFATLFLDHQLRVKRYTERTKDLIPLIPSDIGRPLGDLTSNLDYENLLSDCESVLRSLIPKEVEVCDRTGAWHQMRVMPYRTAENVIDGVVIAFVNIDRLKSAELAAATISDSFEDIVQTAREPFLALDGRGRIFLANEALCRMFDVNRERLFGAGLQEAFNGRWDVPELHDLIEKSLPAGAGNVEATVSLGAPGGASKTFSVRARKLERGGNLGRMILLTFDEGRSKG